mgnify:CR=1|jgi:predicted  nucleic acid-binding Zn-ribbon protein
MGGSNKNNTLEKKVDDILNIVIHIQEHALTKEEGITKKEGVTKKEFKEMRNDVGIIQNDIGKINNRLEYMSQDIKEVKQHVIRVETKVDRIDKRSVEDTDVLAKDIFDHEVRITKLEKVTA